MVRRDAFADMAGTINGEAWQFIGLYSIKTLASAGIVMSPDANSSISRAMS